MELKHLLLTLILAVFLPLQAWAGNSTKYDVQFYDEYKEVTCAKAMKALIYSRSLIDDAPINREMLDKKLFDYWRDYYIGTKDAVQKYCR